jgi:hypothetical protein
MVMGALLLLLLLPACGTVQTNSKVILRDSGVVLSGQGRVAVFPAFARSGVQYAKRKVETILRYHLLLNEKKLGWQMVFPDDVKKAILDAKADDLYLVVYHKYNALSHFAAEDLAALGGKLKVGRILIPEMVQESVKSGPYWISGQGSNLQLSKLYDDYYVRLVLHVFDVGQKKVVYRIRTVGRVTKAMFQKDNSEESLGRAYSGAIEDMLVRMLEKKK